jgi:allantoinase
MAEHLFDLAITGDICFGSHIVREGTLLVEGERISGITDHVEQIQAKKVINGRGKWVLPGAIDSHVHSLSFPGEGFFNSTRSGAAGGVTTLIDMPVDAPRGIAEPEALVQKISLVETESLIDVALLGSVKNETIGQIPRLAEGGVCGFKLSLFDTDPDRFPRVHDGQMLEAFSAIAETGLSAGVHAENDEIIKYLIAKYTRQGKTYPSAHCETRPVVSETESVLKALEFAWATGVRLHLYHMSHSRSLQLAQLYRGQGTTVTSETCPHYLVFSEEDMERLGARIRINPPVRKRPEADLLWHMIAAGAIDCVSSDHAPWPADRKNKPVIFDNASGCPGVETLLPLMFSEGVVKGRVSIPILTTVLSENPARIFRLFPKKGILLPGSDADIVIVDPARTWTVRADELHAAADWTPYEGMELTGKVETTIVRGRIVFDRGDITVQKGYGKFVRPVSLIPPRL